MSPGSHPYDAAYPRLSNSALLAIAGGFLDGFTYVTRNHVFANAMSGNVVLLGIGAVSGAWTASLRHLPPILTFLLAIFAARALHLPGAAARIRRPKSMVLLIELAILTIVSFLPNRVPDLWVTTTIAFAASMQVETFRTVNGQNFNTTFVTGNLRTLGENLFDWVLGIDREKARRVTLDFTTICLAFLLGATGGGFLGGRYGNRALWADVVLFAAILLRVQRSRAEPVTRPPEP